MAFITDIIVNWPDRYTVEYSGKRCYTAYLQMFDENNNLLYSFSPTAIVSMSSNRVITSYGSINQDCSRFAAWQY